MMHTSVHNLPAWRQSNPPNLYRKLVYFQHQIPVIKAPAHTWRTGVRCHVKTPLDSSNISQSEQPRGFGTIHKTANGEDAGTMEVVDEVSEFDDDESVKSENGIHEYTDVQDVINGLKGELTIDTIASTFPYELDGFQKKAIKTILDGKSCVVCAPTGAGKTAIAEAAAMLCLGDGQRIIYTTPLKALSNQKLQEFQERFGANKVGLITGDISIQQNAPIVVMTTEILRNIMYSADEDSMDRLKHVAMIVLDEVHYLGDPYRGTVWEEVIVGCPRGIRMLCMSATVANPGDLGGWISMIHGSCKTVKTMFRPVPLKWYFARTEDGAATISTLFGSGKAMNPGIRLRTRKWNDIVKKVPTTRALAEALEENDFLPAIVFVFSRKMCDMNAVALRKGGFKFNSKFESDAIRKAIQELKSEQPEAVRHKLAKSLIDGIASHHAGCLPGWKSLVEKLFQDGLIKIVFATETLAAGINMPARTTVIVSPSKGGRSTGRTPLTHNQLLQMAGRAGRRGYDTIGNCVICQSRFDTPQGVVDTINKGPEPLTSQFKSGYSLVLNLLSRYSRSEAEKFCSRSFRNYLAQGVLREHVREVNLIRERTVPLQMAAQHMDTEGEELKSVTRSEKREIEKSLSSVTVALNNELERRTANIRALLHSNSLPVAIEVNRIAHLEQGSDAVTMPLLAFDIHTNSEQDWIVCLGMDNNLRRVPFDRIVTVYTILIEDDTNLAHLHARNTEAEKQGLWKKRSDHEWSIKGNIWTAKLVRGTFAKMGSRDSWEQVAGCEEQWLRVQGYASERDELLTQKHLVWRKYKKMNKEELRISKRLLSAEKELERAEKKTDSISSISNVNWKEFQSKMAVLEAAGALQRETNDILPLGKVARELHGENELWLAMALTHPSTAMLTPVELAGFTGALVAYECVSKPDIASRYPTPQNIFKMLTDLESTLDDLESWEWEVDIDSQITMDARLSGLVTAWAQGCSWEDIMNGTTLEDGDIARLLTRTIDLLRQMSACRHLMGPLRSTARQAYYDMNRTPIAESAS